MLKSYFINQQKELFKYFKLNRRIVDIKDFNLEHAEIYSRDILHKIANREKGWESQLPEGEFIYSSTDLKGVIVEANQGSVRLQN